MQYPLVAAFLVVFLVIGWQGRVPAMRASGDDEFKYLALSKSLESGSYREIYRLDAPLHVQYPPGYPAWLIVVRHTLGENLDVIRATNLLLSALVFVLWFLVARKLVGPGLALGFLLLLVLNRGLLMMGSSLASESLFLLVSSAGLAAMLSSERSSARTLFCIMAIGVLAFLSRSMGLALVLAVGAWLWSQRRRGALLVWGATTLLVVGGWFAYTIVAPANSTVRSYASAFAGTTGAAPSGASPLRVLAGRIWHHATSYATTDMPYLFSLPSIGGTLVDNWAWLLVNVVLLSAGLLVLWRTWRAAAVYIVGSACLLLVWPFQDGRLLVPIVPLGLLMLLLGARRLSERLPVPARHLAPGALLALAAIGALSGAREWHARYRDCDRGDPYRSAACYDPPRLALAAGAEYLRLHAAPGDAVMTREPATLNYLSGLHAEPTHLLGALPPGGAVAALQARHIRFVFVSRPWMAKALEPSCRELRLEESYLPLAVLVSATPPGAASPDACPALRELASKLLPPPK